MTLEGLWFTEQATEIGSALSLQCTEKLHQEQTPYQHLEIYKTTHFGNLMVLDGFIMLSQRDNFIYHEMMVHPALYSHQDPKNVAIIGGGDCGSLQEVLKHQCVQQVWQIEIDERVTRNAEQYFPELCESNDDPRAQLLFVDGIKWMQQQTAGSLDIIIVDSTDPIGPAEGLFRKPFYQSCHRALGEHGILVQQSESPLVHDDSILLPMHREMRAAGFASTEMVFFPLTVYPTGWWSATLASKQKVLSYARQSDAVSNPFSTQYYNSEIHQAAFAQPQFIKQKFTKL